MPYIDIYAIYIYIHTTSRSLQCLNLFFEPCTFNLGARPWDWCSYQTKRYNQVQLRQVDNY